MPGSAGITGRGRHRVGAARSEPNVRYHATLFGRLDDRHSGPLRRKAGALTEAQRQAAAAADGDPDQGSDGVGVGAAALPRRFGKYTLIRKLAVGGMAELFLALQRSMAGFEKLIVVKRVLPHLAQDEQFIEMLLSEARIAATLNHPNVAHIYDVGMQDDQYYIAMEHIHGEDLRSIVRQMRHMGLSSFPVEHALAIVLGCCAGLAYAHEMRDLDGEPLNIVHRDVSPQNILVTFSGDVKLVDFGIAKAGRSAREQTQSGKLKGKVPYMSPEQARGAPLDGRSDIFSLGIILFELCTGRRLFKGRNEFDTMRMIVDADYPWPRTINPGLPEQVEQIIVRALAKECDQRYQTAREMQADLEGLIRDLRLAVSPLSLGAWMRELFADKLSQQKSMLQEGRALADVLSSETPVAEDDVAGTTARQLLQTGVRPRRTRRLPVVAAALVALAAGGGGLAYLADRPTDEATVAPMTGSLTLRTTPAGATIRINGNERREHTPAVLSDLSLGSSYQVELSLPGYSSHAETITLTAEVPRGLVAAQLGRNTAEAFAVLRLTSTPPGARVLLDGSDTGLTTPATVPRIESGMTHRLLLLLDGHEQHLVELSFAAGEIRELEVPLDPTPLAADESLLRLSVDPEGAAIEIEGRQILGPSPHVIRRGAGPVRIVVHQPGFRRYETTLALGGGETREHRVTLVRRVGGSAAAAPTAAATTPAPGRGRLTVGARPWCTVSVDGRAIGQTPIVNHDLAAGSHRITCSNPELGATRQQTVVIRPGETTRTRIDLD